jgi:hypothetical protein
MGKVGHTVIMNNVPDNEVAELVSDFEDDGATVSKVREPDGEWTVIAVYPTPHPVSAEREK